MPTVENDLPSHVIGTQRELTLCKHRFQCVATDNWRSNSQSGEYTRYHSKMNTVGYVVKPVINSSTHSVTPTQAPKENKQGLGSLHEQGKRNQFPDCQEKQNML